MSDYETAVHAWLTGKELSEERRAAPKSFGMMRASRQNPEQAEALERVRRWTRARFALGDDAPVLVSEVNCQLPGCPPLETVVAFWTDADTRHHFKLFKPVAEVTEDDLPPAFMKNALIASDAIECACC